MTVYKKRMLAAAGIWAFAWMVLAFTYHLNEPIGVLTITVNGVTYSGNPPALTLFERDPFSIELALALVASVLALSVVTEKYSSVDKNPGWNKFALVGGLLLLAYSLFGLLWGFGSIGIVGVLVLLSSSPRGSKRHSASGVPNDETRR